MLALMSAPDYSTLSGQLTGLQVDLPANPAMRRDL
jgi:hypothetical protein